MPLRGTGEQALDIGNTAAVEFTMENYQGRRVVCRISEQALRALELEPALEVRLATFEKHRAEIERVASDAYDTGRFAEDGTTVLITHPHVLSIGRHR